MATYYLHMHFISRQIVSYHKYYVVERANLMSEGKNDNDIEFEGF